MYIEEIKPGFPDCIARRYIGKGWERVSIEFEFQSKNFLQHGHDHNKCDIIVCWEHNWEKCPLEVIELKSEIKDLENYPIKRPITSDRGTSDNTLDNLFGTVKPIDSVKKWYDLLFSGVLKCNKEIWAKVGTKYIGWYCPERAFVSLNVKRQSIRIECFSRGKELVNTRISNIRFSPRWCIFTVKSDEDVQKAIKVLCQAYELIKEAIRAGESTGYFSGGEYVQSAKDVIDSEHDEQEDNNVA
jgi:hypothetical protein